MTLFAYQRIKNKATSCHGKIPYSSRSEASAALTRLQRKAPRIPTKGTMKAEAYRCDHCPNFHIGHAPR